MKDLNYDENLTVIGRFLQQAFADPQRNALLFRDADMAEADEVTTIRSKTVIKSISYGQLAQKIALIVEALKDRGVNHGDHVVQIANNSRHWIEWDLALQVLGAVHVPLSPARSVSEVFVLIDHCQPKLIVLDTDEQIETFLTAKSQLYKQSVVSHSLHASHSGLSQSDNEDPVPDLCELSNTVEDLDPDRLMTIIYTSGTTGSPKGVMLSHHNIAANVRSLLKVSPIRDDETRLCVLPLSHVYARTNDLYATLCSGGCLALGDPRKLVDECRLFRPSFVNGVPYLFEKCKRQFEEQDDPGSLSHFLGGRIEKVNSGGASIPLDVESFFWNNQVPMTTGYGLTETSPVLAASSIEHHKPGTVGRAIPEVDLKMADDGELLTRGPNLMLGYFAQPELTAKAIVEGWLSTGDMGEIDADGFVTIVGRKDELIVTSTGLNISPTELETCLLKHPELKQVCVVGKGQPFLTAIVVLEDLIAELNESATEQLKIELNGLLSNRALHEKIAKLVTANQEFCVADGTLTTKGGMRRTEIEKRFIGGNDQEF